MSYVPDFGDVLHEGEYTSEQIEKARRRLPPPMFAEQFGGEAASYAGLVYPYNRVLHKRPRFSIPEHWTHVVGYDYGAGGGSDPTAIEEGSYGPDGTLYWWGWGQYSAVHQGGKEFGLWARYITDYLAANSPHWAARQLADKLHFVMGSNYQDYAERGRPYAPRVQAIGHAPYVGPKWETGDPPNAVFDDHGVQGTLLGWIAGTALDVDKYRVNRERLAAQGHF